VTQIIDAHVHVGQFRELYVSAQEVADYMASVGVSRYAVSSTSICDNDYDKAAREMVELRAIAGERLIPVMWITPFMLADGGLETMLKTGLDWRCIKIHPYMQPKVWNNREAQDAVASLAKEMDLPILIHTGQTEGAYPLEFEEMIAAHPTVKIILAHGRPVEQAEQLMKQYGNVWADTAFMPTPNIARLCAAGLDDRVMWGSDYGVTRYFYPNADQIAYYNHEIEEMRKTLSAEDFEKVTHENAERMF